MAMLAVLESWWCAKVKLLDTNKNINIPNDEENEDTDDGDEDTRTKESCQSLSRSPLVAQYQWSLHFGAFGDGK